MKVAIVYNYLYLIEKIQMNSITPIISTRINSHISTKFFSNIHNFLKKHSDLLSSATILANDILFLLGETVKSFPKIIGNSSFVILNIAGFLSLSFQFDLLKKCTIIEFFLLQL